MTDIAEFDVATAGARVAMPTPSLPVRGQRATAVKVMRIGLLKRQPARAAGRAAAEKARSAPEKAVLPDRRYFEISEAGTVRIDDAGVASFQAEGSGRDQFLILAPGNTARVKEAITMLATEPPK